MSDFVHLHVHSCFSLLDGAADVGPLTQKAKELGMPAIALTDHDGLYGAIRFYKAAKEADIKPIVGAELTLEGGYHVVLLAMDREGYSNLCRLISASHLARPDGSPELSWSTLAEHSESLIALSGCERGELVSALRGPGASDKGRRGTEPSPYNNGIRQTGMGIPVPQQHGGNRSADPLAAAREVARRYLEVFGRERFFVELQNHLLSGHHRRLRRELARLADELDIRTVATNNVHYVEKEHYRAQDVLVCIRTISTVHDSSPLRKLNAEYYLKSEEEMQHLFRDNPEALRNTREVAEMCNLDLELDTYRFPHFDLPPGETAYSHLCKLCLRGAQKRYKPLTPKVMARLQHELQTINDLGFAEYFLVAWDIVRFAREQGIRCSGRGSAGDSLICHVLGITDADPMAHANLIFERFMSREHSKMPDIDVDYCSRRRDEVVEYIYRKYGDGHVAAVCTLNTFKARSAIREVGKALALDPEDINRMAKAFPYISATEIPDAFESVPEVRDANIDVSNKRDLIEICQLISGFPRHISVHVGGLVITREPLTNLVPLQRAAKGIVVAQYDKDDIEALGLVKMDVLGLRIHTAIADCLEYVRQGRGIDLDLDKIPLDDEATFELIRSTNTIALFQLESPGQRNLLGRSQPETFEELITQISLFRPGPVQSDMISPYLRRRHGEEPVTYPHPALKPILKVTHGVIIYQEQILQIGHALAGFTPGEADKLRRAMTTNRSSAPMRALRESFIKGALNNGVRLEVAEEVWEQVAAFASFGFCKAHACCFAKIAYQTGYLKAHYPAEFLAGILSAQPMGFYPAHVILQEAKRCGVGVLPPDINKSMDRYTVEDGKIRVGLGQMRQMTQSAMRSIIEARRERRFTSLRDFCSRTRVPKPVIENLILAGALRQFDTSQERLLWRLAGLPETKVGGLQVDGRRHATAARASAGGGDSGRGPGRPKAASEAFDFGLTEALESQLPEFTPLSEVDRTRYDLDLLGIATVHHPLHFLRPRLREQRVLEASRLRLFKDGDEVRVAGVVVSRNRPPTRSGQTVVFVTMEDETGVVEVVIFSNVYDKYGRVIYESPGLIVEGKLSRQGKRDIAVLADRVTAL